MHFTCLPRSPQWMDLYQIWYGGSSRRRNQLCRFCRSVQGYQFCRGWNMPIPIAIEGCRWHYLNYHSDCDTFIPEKDILAFTVTQEYTIKFIWLISSTIRQNGGIVLDMLEFFYLSVQCYAWTEYKFTCVSVSVTRLPTRLQVRPLNGFLQLIA